MCDQMHVLHPAGRRRRAGTALFCTGAKRHEVPGQQLCLAQPIAATCEGVHRAGIHKPYTYSGLCHAPVALSARDVHLRKMTSRSEWAGSRCMCRLPVCRWHCWGGTSVAVRKQVRLLVMWPYVSVCTNGAPCHKGQLQHRPTCSFICCRLGQDSGICAAAAGASAVPLAAGARHLRAGADSHAGAGGAGE